jgi:hypothetical protein
MYRRSAIKIPFTERQIAPGAPIEALKRVGGTCNFHERNAEWRRSRFEVHSVFAYRAFQVENDVGQVMVVTRDERSVLGFNFLHVIDCIGDDDAIPCSVGIHR